MIGERLRNGKSLKVYTPSDFQGETLYSLLCLKPIKLILVEKQTYFENLPRKYLKLNICSFSIFSFFLLAHCETQFTSLPAAKTACFNFLLNIEPVNLLNSRVAIYLA